MTATRTFRLLPFVAVAALSVTAFFSAPETADAHCQVPCGIYDDNVRFVLMKEHAATIAKAATQITELAGKTDGQSAQQLARWVANKESHAQEIQQISLDYFLAQRLKPGAAGDDAADKKYRDQLAAVHQVIVLSMKCKQNADPALAVELTKAIEAFQKAYGA